MANKRYINTKFWDDNYVVNLDPIEKLLFLYFLTNPLTNICGCYEIQLRRIAFDTGIDKEMIFKIIERFSKDNKLFYVDGWVIITNFIKNQALNPDVKKGIERELCNLPDTVCDRLVQTATYLTKLNLTLPNLTKPNLTPTGERNFKNLIDQGKQQYLKEHGMGGK